MQGVIIYKGKYGATRQYADWTAEMLGLPVVAAEKTAETNLELYDFIILGTSVYMGQLLMKNWIKQNIKTLQDKNVFLFIVSRTPPSDPVNQQKILDDNVPVLFQKDFNTFFLPGRLIKKELSWTDRLLVKFGAMVEKDPTRKKAMLEDTDDVKQENLQEMVRVIRSISTRIDVQAGPGLPVQT